MIEVTEEMIDLVYNWRSKSPSPYFALEHTVRAIIELHEANKPKPEPVAWMSPNKERLEFSRIDTVYGSHTIPLYTTPPTREPLSEDELREILNDINKSDGTLHDFARAVEQAHGIGTTK